MEISEPTARQVETGVIEIESDALFPFRGSSMLPEGEARALRDQLNAALGED